MSRQLNESAAVVLDPMGEVVSSSAAVDVASIRAAFNTQRGNMNFAFGEQNRPDGNFKRVNLSAPGAGNFDQYVFAALIDKSDPEPRVHRAQRRFRGHQCVRAPRPERRLLK